MYHVYFAKKMSVTESGSRIKEVVCEKCGAQFFYELRRTFTASRDAPYYIGQASARRKAQEAACRGLEKRLATESETVPCPDCHWINQSLVDDYRRTLYRDFSNFAGPILGVGILVSVLSAIFSFQSWADTKIMRAWAMGSLGLAVGGWWLLKSVQSLLRRRIDPNARFPEAPVVPVGTPVALVAEVDSAEGDPILVPTAPAVAAVDDGGADVWVVFQAGQIYFPPVCCVCMAPAMKVYSSPLKVDEGSDVGMPLCGSCSLRLSVRWWLIALLLLLMIAAVCTLLAMTATFGNAFGRGFAFGGIGLLAAIIAVATVPAGITRPYRFKIVDRSRGVMKLAAANQDYTRLLIEQVEAE